jgi:hypothetical protein
MSRFKRGSLLILLVGLSGSALANKSNKVYKCVRNGVTIFSQVECGQDAKKVEVKLAQPEPDAKTVAAYKKQQSAVYHWPCYE